VSLKSPGSHSMPTVTRGPEKRYGIVAVLDALGAAGYGDTEVRRFMESRELVLNLLTEKIESQMEQFFHMVPEAISVFTFNDTVLIAYVTGSDHPMLPRVAAFFRILRKFIVDSLCHGILFRGSVAIGTFYVDEGRNTVMGQAVTDAAAWYDKADWIGIHATPRATISIQALLEVERHNTHEMLDFVVPMTNGREVLAKVVDWPKAFLYGSMTPCCDGEKPREKILKLLSRHVIPLGTETKYTNTIKFFDHSAADLARIRQNEAKKKRGHS